MAKVIFENELCKGCKLCTIVCPKGIIKMSDVINSKGYNQAIIENIEKCIGCGFCATICPDMVITVEN
jgi:2-oxoglutarate ferredoxin oxidoreductase subunit delta